MVYPVSSPLVQQQIPAANTFQPGGTESVKRPEENRTEDATRPTGSDSARTEAANNRQDERREEVSASSRSEDNGRISTSGSRGTQLDISA
jgi:hypothetical protein